MRTSELTGAALDWAVAKCEGYTPDDGSFDGPTDFFFSIDWGLGGPIIERERISIEYMAGSGDAGADVWVATRIEGASFSEEQGDTPLIAAMRCFVCSKLGDEVDVPEGLV